MKRELHKRKDENLGGWCERIAPLCKELSPGKMFEVLHNVSVKSYIEGSNSAIAMMKKYPNTFK